MDRLYNASKNFLDVKIKKLSKFLNINSDLAFLNLCMGLVSDLDENNIDDDFIVDGSGEKQIDAIYVHERGQKIIDIFQTKKTNGFSSNCIIQIGNGLNWIFEKSESSVKKLSNIKFRNKINDIRDIWDTNLKVNVYFCTLGDDTEIPKESLEEKSSIVEKYNKILNNNFNFQVIGAQSLYGLILEREKAPIIINEQIKYEHHQDIANLLDYYIDKCKGVICTVRATEIARIVKGYGNILFEANVRRYLGDNKVNRSIFDTCTSKENSQLFWFYNNGITIVCEDYNVSRAPRNPHVEVKNAQIVNGCQTAVTLFNAAHQKKLNKDTKVLVKIFSTKNEQFIDKITEATNNQSSINSRDLRANDKFQIIIEKHLKEKFNYYYERKRNQYKDESSIDKSNIINNEKVAQAFLAIGKKKPSTAKSSKGRLFSDEYYEEIFSNSVERLLAAYKIVEYAVFKKRDKTKNEVDASLKIYGFLHIARMMAFFLFESEAFPKDKDLDDIIRNLKIKDLDILYNKSFKLLKKAVSSKNNKKEIDSYNNYFKISDSEVLVNSLIKEFADKSPRRRGAQRAFARGKT